MKNKWSYGYIIRDKEGVVRMEAEGYKTQKQAERAGNEALSIMPEDYNLEIRYASPVFKPKNENPFGPSVDHLDWTEEEELLPNTIIH